MKAHRVCKLAIVLVLLASAMGAAESDPFFRSVGVRIALPWTGGPLLFGIQATTPLVFGVGTGAFFLASDGTALITLSGDIAVTATGGSSAVYVRITAGLAYFEAGSLFPIPTAGVGLVYRIAPSTPVEITFAGEFLYPIAIPLPLFSIAAEWML